MKSILFNEWKILIRTPWFLIVGLVLSAILATTSWLGVQETQLLAYQQQEASEHIREQWDNQKPGNPHNAAHYGTYLFKPSSPLTGFDEGVNGILGRTLYLEGHQQNEAQFSDASQSIQASRFGKLRPALLLQLIVPLLLIFLVFSSIRSERESDRIRLLLSQGLNLKKLVFGKTLAYWLVSLFFLVITLSLQVLLQWKIVNPHVFTRSLLIFLSYALFYWIICSLTAYLSARLSQAGTALSLMLSCWIVWGIFLPKVTGSMAEKLYQLPTRQEFAEGMKNDRAKGFDGHNPEEKKLAQLKDSVLRQYQVTTVEELPINLDGVLMQADEEIGNLVWDKHFGNLNQVILQQKKFIQASSITNPLQCLQSISMGFSGTDYLHHADFMLKAEQYRREFIKTLNDKHAYGGSKTGDWEWAVDQEFYKSLKDFQYQPTSVDQLYKVHWSDLAILLGWSLLGLLFLSALHYKL